MKIAAFALLFLPFLCAAQEVRPYTPSLDPASMDRSVDPCVDFFKYACGAWNNKNPIPADRTEWSVYSKTSENNLVLLRSILEKAAAARERDAVTQKVGDFYGACMDESAVNRRGISALRPELESIRAIKSVHDIAPVAAHLQLAVQGSPILFGSGSLQDFDDAEKEIASIDQGGLGLPNRDYYTTDDAKSKEIRERYVQHLQKVFLLMGDSSGAAKKHAAIVMRIETAFAKASLTSVERRDPHKLKNKMSMAEL
jgi:putative endopeptidase